MKEVDCCYNCAFQVYLHINGTWCNHISNAINDKLLEIQHNNICEHFCHEDNIANYEIFKSLLVDEDM